MERQWETMETREKDLIIAKEILAFNCFNKAGGLEWYNEQYSLGHWRYCTNIEDALDMLRRVIGESRQAHITIGNDCFECNILTDRFGSKMINIASNSLPELFCLIAIYIKGYTIHSK